MKKNLLYLLLTLFIFAFSSCDDDENPQQTFTVNIQLAYPDDEAPAEGVEVSLYSTSTTSAYQAQTNANGLATFTVVAGVYEASATEKRYVDGVAFVYNGLKSAITITPEWNNATPVELDLTASATSQIIIKELYNGGCQRNDGSGVFARDQYIILYNNSDATASLDKICLAMVLPYNSNAQTNHDYSSGSLSYETLGWVPAGTGIWYFTNSVSLEPGEQIVIALTNALDNTQLYTNSINFDNSQYYCLYDIESYANTMYYPTPAPSIPSSHYLKAYHYGTGNAWPLSQVSPAMFIFTPKDGTTLESFIQDASTTDYYNNSTSQVRKKVPVEWVNDAIEVYRSDATNNWKRMPTSVDAGFVNLTNQHGHSLYRNVDKEATLAVEGNEAKLVYGYASGLDSTDESNIDAEASIRNGARIVYRDTNNSTNDFHERGQASLKN